MVTYYGILRLSAALSIFFRLGGAIFRRNIIVQSKYKILLEVADIAITNAVKFKK